MADQKPEKPLAEDLNELEDVNDLTSEEPQDAGISLEEEALDFGYDGDDVPLDGTAEAEDNQVIALQEELQATKDKLLRAVAELENGRKRAEREKEQVKKFAVQDFAKDVVAVADNLQRALTSIPPEAKEEGASAGLKNFITGVEMTDKALVDAFGKHGLSKVDPTPGDAFDYNVHQAMQQAEGTDFPPGSVTQVWQTGWLLNGRLLRPAMVAVAAGEVEGKPNVDTEA